MAILRVGKTWSPKNTHTLKYAFIATQLNICMLYDPAVPNLTRDAKDTYTYMLQETDVKM